MKTRFVEALLQFQFHYGFDCDKGLVISELNPCSTPMQDSLFSTKLYLGNSFVVLGPIYPINT